MRNVKIEVVAMDRSGRPIPRPDDDLSFTEIKRERNPGLSDCSQLPRSL